MTEFLHLWPVHILNATVQGSLAILLALAICHFAIKIPARIRAWIMRISLIKLLIAGIFVGGVAVAQLPQNEKSTAPNPMLETMILVSACLWACCVIISTIRLFKSTKRLDQFLSRTIEVKELHVLKVYQDIAKSLGINSLPRLVSHPEINSPRLIKRRGNVIVLSQDILDINATEKLSVVLAHELAHHRHGDLAWGWLQTITDALFFFNPLVGLAHKQLRLMEEYAADATAIRVTGCKPAIYSHTLLSFLTPSVAFPQAYAMADGSKELEQRIQESFVNRKTGIVDVLLAFVLCSVITVIALVPWTMATPQPLSESQPPISPMRIAAPMGR